MVKLKEYSNPPSPKTVIHKYFIKTEVEVSSFFALSALEDIIMKPQKSLLELFEDGDIEVSLPFPLPPGRNLLESLLTASSPEDYQAMTASHEEDHLVVRLVVVEEEKVVELRDILAKITFKDTIEDVFLIIGGKVLEKIPPGSDIKAIWEKESGYLEKF